MKTSVMLEALKKRLRKSSPWLAFSGLVLFIILLHQNNFNIPFNRDEGEYAYSAWLMKNGEMPYQDSYLQKPPMIIYTYYLAQIFSPSYWPSRVLSYLAVFLTAVLLYLSISREWGKRAGLGVIWFVPILVLLPGFDQFAANTEMFMILPIAGVLAIYAIKKDDISIWPCFFSGALSAAAIFYKYNIALVLFFIFCVWIAELWLKRKSLAEIIKKIFFGLVGFAAASLLILLPFLLHDGGKTLWECTVKFNKYYSSSSIFGFAGLSYYLKLFFAKWWLLIIASIVFFVVRPKRWWFYAGLIILSLIESVGSWYGHYYIVFMLFWSVILAYSADFLADFLSQRFSFKVTSDGKVERRRPDRAKLKFILIAFLVVAAIIPSADLIFASKKDFSEKKLGGENPFLEAVVVSEKIKKETNSKDYILVAGSEPEILYYSKRMNATRFDIIYPMMIDTALAQGYQEEAIQEIKSKEPKVIAYVNSYYSWTPGKNSPKEFQKFLESLIKEKYDIFDSTPDSQIALYRLK